MLSALGFGALHGHQEPILSTRKTHSFVAGEMPQHQSQLDGQLQLAEANWRTQSLTPEIGVCEHGCAGTEEFSTLGGV